MFLLENVPGFKRMYGGAAFEEAVRLFSALGYTLTDTVLNAADYGVPQRRQRFVMVGWNADSIRDFVWPLPTHGRSSEPTLFEGQSARYTTVEDALGDLAFLEPGWEAHRYVEDATSAFQQQRRSASGLLFNHLATKHRERTRLMFSHIPPGRTIAAVPEHLRTAKRTMARLDKDEVSNAVLALPDDLIHYKHHRTLTVREMARLQTFDDDYAFFGKRTTCKLDRRTDVPQYTQLGNAVPPALARALGRSILESLSEGERDAREPEERRTRHHWIRGTSGFNGYTLSPAASDDLTLWSVRDARLSLPVSADDTLVADAPQLGLWGREGMRPAWLPTAEEAAA
jgi:DNA (cytosine-5)-methyltransferase 1